MTNKPHPDWSSPSARYKYFVLAMLTIVYIFNFLDRQILVILQESIKKDLDLSDTQLGLLSGFSFAIFYTLVGIPIARFADKGNRKNIVTISLIIWSLMTTLSGIIQNFGQLLLARIGVGVGEAGGSPPAHAMISDYFPMKKRAFALSVYSTGIYFGIMGGFLIGGYLDQYYGWRIAFMVLGIPGIIFAILFYFTVKEPLRGATEAFQIDVDKSLTIWQVFQYMFSKKSFVMLAFATGILTFVMYGTSNWLPSFLFRIHKMSSVEAGAVLGIIIGIGGGVGTLTGGYLTDRLGRKDKKWYVKVPAFSILIALPFAGAGIFLNHTSLVLLSLGITVFLYSMYLGPTIAITHSLVPVKMRAFSSAILFLIMDLLGLGFGPLTIEVISDFLTPSLGHYALRWAMSITLIFAFFASMLYIQSGKTLYKDLKQ